VEIAWTSATSKDGGLNAFIPSRIVSQETLQDGFLLSSQHGDAATVEAGNLPVKRTATHIYFFGYEGSNPEVCFQQWFPSPFTDDSLDGSPGFLTSEHYVMYGKALLFGDEVVSWLRRYREKPRLLGRQGGYVSFRLTSSECTIGDWGKLR
jgi:hypothetical protein